MMKPLNKWMLMRTAVVTAGVLFLLAATNTGGDHDEATRAAHSINERSLKGLTTDDLVDLRVSYGKRKRFRWSASDRTVLISQQAVYRTVLEVRKRIALPFDIKVVFEECGDPDSFYDEDAHEIIICYGLIDIYSELFSRTLSPAARDEAAKGAVVSMFLHEVAHALIDGWDLSITGREEDAADQFATLMLVNGLPDGEKMALDSARSFKSLEALEKGLPKDYSDPHSLDAQRFYNTICLVYGHRPERNEYLVRNGSLPAERAAECEEDYARLHKSWQTLLAPHLVGQNAIPGF